MRAKFFVYKEKTGLLQILLDLMMSRNGTRSVQQPARLSVKRTQVGRVSEIDGFLKTPGFIEVQSPAKELFGEL